MKDLVNRIVVVGCLLAMTAGAVLADGQTRQVGTDGTNLAMTADGAEPWTSEDRFGPVEFVSYVTTAAGPGVSAGGRTFPVATFSSGLQLGPGFAIGGFVSPGIVSDFEHAQFGVDLADRENGYVMASGTELIVTPWHNYAIHPIVRLELGGMTVGYMEDNDGEEGMDASYDRRYLYATVAAGSEVDLRPHLRAFVVAGYRFVGNDDWIGIDSGELSGLTASVGARILWKTTLD